MPETATAVTPLVENVSAQLAFVQWAILKNLDDISDAEALAKPIAAANSINWIAGHLVCVRNHFLTAFGVPSIFAAPSIEAYNRGSKPGETLPESLATLREKIVRSHESLLSLIAGFDEAKLAEPAPFSPGGGPETVGSLLLKVVVHEGYHSGQLGIARKLIGKAGAI